MRKLFIYILLTIAFLSIGSLAFSQMKASYHFNVSMFGNTTVSYKQYTSNTPSDSYLIFLPGRGEVLVGPATEVKLNKVDVAGYGKRAREGEEFPFNIIAIQAYHSTSAGSATYSTVMRHFLHYVKLYKNADKIVVTGYSLGGQETYNVSLRSLDIQLIDGLVSVAGRPDAYSSADPCSMKDVPMIAVHGDKDNTVPYSQDLAWVNKVNTCPDRVNKIKFISLPGVGHDSWTWAYQRDNEVDRFIHTILAPTPDRYQEGYNDAMTKITTYLESIK